MGYSHRIISFIPKGAEYAFDTVNQNYVSTQIITTSFVVNVRDSDLKKRIKYFLARLYVKFKKFPEDK